MPTMHSLPHTDAVAPSLGRRLLGVLLTLFLAFSVAVSGVDMGAEGVVWSGLAAATGMLLLVAAWLNLPLLWNPLGRLLRSLLGERGARIAFGCTAIAFILSVGLGTIVP